MTVIYNPFLRKILHTHEAIHHNTLYPFFDQACRYYEAIRAVLVDQTNLSAAFEKFGITEYQYRKALATFRNGGVAKLIGIAYPRLTESLDLEAERMIYVLKKARPSIPATKMVTILHGFGFEIDLSLMRHLYASYGWAQGTKTYEDVDFQTLNLKVAKLTQTDNLAHNRDNFFLQEDRLQNLLEVFRRQDPKEISRHYPGSRVSLQKHRKSFNVLGLLGLVEQARPSFRNSKLGFKEEGWMILSKIQHLEKDEADYLEVLRTKKINVDLTCIKKIFNRWKVTAFQSKFKGNLERFLSGGDTWQDSTLSQPSSVIPDAGKFRMDAGFVEFLRGLQSQSVPLANPGIFLFLPLLHRLKFFDVAANIIDTDPDNGYSWFSLLILNLARIFGGVSSISKACRTSELSFPLCAGLVEMPCKDTLLNGLATISEQQLLQFRRNLTGLAYNKILVKGRSIALDFHMRDFTGEDIALKNIGKGPSPKRKICFPGFRPHIAWDVETGTPISLEFRNGTARATTTFENFIRDLLPEALSDQNVEHVYLDSEYTAQKVWHFIVDRQNGLGADLTMCIKQNPAVKKYIAAFMETSFEWLFFDENHTYSNTTFTIPIQRTNKELHCVLKRHKKTGRLRCFGSTIIGLDARKILKEYERRWVIENGIKDLVGNYFFDNIPGIDPHRINIHYFVVTLARLLYQMFCNLYPASENADGSQKGIGTIRQEFIVGTNAKITRKNDTLIITWHDLYSEKDHANMATLFDALNETRSEPISFLGGLKLEFKLVPPRDKKFHNQLQRKKLDFG
jgi:hypothetical protein